MVIRGPTSLPAVALPNLAGVHFNYDHDLHWPQGFRGVTLEKLETVSFCTESDYIGDPLGAFENVALAMSNQNTLSKFAFYTSGPRSWNPNYSSPFVQATKTTRERFHLLRWLLFEGR